MSFSKRKLTAPLLAIANRTGDVSIENGIVAAWRRLALQFSFPYGASVITKIYKANRDKSECSVTVNGEPLPIAEPIEEDRYNFPTVREFSWGDDSEASRYLAFCILHDFARDKAHVLYPKFHQDFIKQVIDDDWQITNEELEEGIAFWCETMKIMPLSVPGQPMKRIVIPPFIYRVFIKSRKLSGSTVKPEQVDEALKKLGEMRSASELRSVVSEEPSSYAPIILPEK